MSRKTVIGLILFSLFVVASIVGGEAFHQLMYMIGCFAVGWNIPYAADLVERTLFKEAK